MSLQNIIKQGIAVLTIVLLTNSCTESPNITKIKQTGSNIATVQTYFRTHCNESFDEQEFDDLLSKARQIGPDSALTFSKKMLSYMNKNECPPFRKVSK